jgi:hypothetical protein
MRARTDHGVPMRMRAWIGALLLAGSLPGTAAAAAFAHPQALSGAWYDPTLPGEGFFVLVAEAGTVVTWYGYDRAGARLWLLTNAHVGGWTAGTAVSLTAYRGSGGVFGLPQTAIEPWGSLSVRFDSCTAAEFTLAGADGTRVARTVQLAGVAGAGDCDRGAHDYQAFADPQAVTINGYTGDAMEPFATRDGRWLLFNDTNAPGANTDLHYAERVDDLTFTYRGRIGGVNTPVLDAVASLDSNGNFYYVSTQFYFQTLSTLYRGRFVDGQVSEVALLPGLSELVPGHLNFDAEISADGDTLYFVDGVFNGGSFPAAADLAIATRGAQGLARAANSSTLLAAVNTDDLEYAPASSRNGLELFFSRYADGEFRIWRSARWRNDAAFEPPQIVAAIRGFVEAPSLSVDERSLYYHVRVGDRFQIFRVRR